MISAIFRHLLSLAVYTLIFVPLLTVFPIFSLATPFIIWLHPTSYNYLFAEVWKFHLGGLLFVSVLPFCTFSPMFVSWLRGREA